MAVEAQADRQSISAIRFSKDQEGEGFGILVRSLHDVSLWPGGFRTADPFIFTTETTRLEQIQ